MQKKFKLNRKKKLIILAVAILSLTLIGITYSYFSANIIYVNKTDTVLHSQGLTLTFRGTNEVVNCGNIIPGDKCIKEFEVENTSNVETFYNIYMEDVTNGFNEDLVYTLEEDNTEIIPETVAPVTATGKTYIKTGVTIAAKATKKYKLTITFKYKDTDQNVNQGKEFRTTVGIDTVQVSASDTPLCIIAKELHTQDCENNSFCAYENSSGKVTYGQIGDGSSIKLGDAYDCDVNGDGTYDAEKERFYYVTKNSSNNAVLMASFATSGGQYTKSDEVMWGTQQNGPNDGPVTARDNLPTTSQWPNVSLETEKLDITDLSNNTVIADFSYSGFAARLLTANELQSACGFTAGSNTVGEVSNKCRFMLENTAYLGSSGTYKSSVWLNDFYSSSSKSVAVLIGPGGQVSNNSPVGSALAKPVIEAKINSDYTLSKIGKSSDSPKIRALKSYPETKIAETIDESQIEFDNTNDKNLRYIGANPNNYIKVGDELYRIIGFMNNVELANGSKKTLMKVTKASSIGSYNMFYTKNNADSYVSYNNATYDWSKTDLKDYLNTTESKERYISSNSTDHSVVGTTSTGYYANLSSVDNKIASVVWNLGSFTNNDSSSNYSYVGTAKAWYDTERSSTSPTFSGSNGIQAPTTWTGKVGLISPSDYGYATNGTNSTNPDHSNYNRAYCLNKSLNYYYDHCYTTDWLAKDNHQWTMVAKLDTNQQSGHYYYVSGVSSSVSNLGLQSTWGAYSYDVYPTLFISDVYHVVSGAGTEQNPYILND